MTFLALVFSPIGRYLAIGLVVLAAFGGVYMKGRSDGADKVQAKWDAAVQAAISRGEKARSDAESSVGREPADGVRDDKFDRD